MHTWVRVTVTTALALTCLDGQAKVVVKCVQTLEVQPTRSDATTPRICPLAIGYTPRQPVPSAHRWPTRGRATESLSHRTMSVDGATADADAVHASPARHV